KHFSASETAINPSESTSQKTGVAPTLTTASAVEIQVSAGTITSSPLSTPNAFSANSKASVPLEQAIAEGKSNSSRIFSSNNNTSSPAEKMPRSKISANFSFSSPDI